MASDCRYGASEESRVRGTWSRKENAARTARGTSVLHTLEKYFPECYTGFLGVGPLLQLWRWYVLSPARVSSVRRCRTSAFGLVLSVLHTPLWATRSDPSIPPSEGIGRGFDRSGTGSPQHTPD